MESLLNDLLAYSRAGSERSTFEELDVKKLVRGVIDLLSQTHELNIESDIDLPVITAPKAPLELVFRNLISNAIKYHDKSDGWIKVIGIDSGPFYEFTVSDNGPGISPEYHEKIFEMFQMLQSKDKVEGTGMGLALVKKIVVSHGGQIKIESEEGKGSMFRFTWPKK